jgi:type I restriction enzyme S subunit
MSCPSPVWQSRPVSDFCLDVGTIDPAKTPEREFDYIDIASIDRIRKVITAPQKVSGADAPSRARQVVKQGDVLVSTVRPNLNAVAQVPFELDGQVASTGFCVLRPAPEKIHSRLVHYWVRTPPFVQGLMARVRGANYPAVRDADVLSSQITTSTDLREQARIVELLDQADALCRQRTDADAKLSRLFPALFRHHFGDPVSNERQWPTDPLTKICEPRQWPTISQKELTESGYTVYGANGPIGFYSEFNHETPTVLITCRGATCGTINVSPPKCYVTGNAMSLDNPDPTRTTNEFLEVFLRTRGLSDTITGAAQPQITRANLTVVQVFTPPMPLVERFSAQVCETKQILAQAAASAAKLETLFQTLLHRAFTGELTAKWRETHLREGVQEMSRASRI